MRKTAPAMGRQPQKGSKVTARSDPTVRNLHHLIPAPGPVESVAGTVLKGRGRADREDGLVLDPVGPPVTGHSVSSLIGQHA